MTPTPPTSPRAPFTFVQIGYISMQADESTAERMARVASYVTIFTGKKPKQHELDRFFARHGFVPETTIP